MSVGAPTGRPSYAELPKPVISKGSDAGAERRGARLVAVSGERPEMSGADATRRCDVDCRTGNEMLTYGGGNRRRRGGERKCTTRIDGSLAHYSPAVSAECNCKAPSALYGSVRLPLTVNSEATLRTCCLHRVPNTSTMRERRLPTG